MISKKTVKDTGGFLAGFFIIAGFLTFIFVGCNRVNEVRHIPSNYDNAQNSSINRTLYLGMQGGDIALLHEKLHEKLQFPETEILAQAGIFTEETQYYVSLFQVLKNLTPNGIVSESTWKALDKSADFSEEDILDAKFTVLIDAGEKNIEDENINYYPWKVKKIAYLTFEDGPDPLYTPQIIELLNKYGASATFFALGENVEKYPDTLRMINEGNFAVSNKAYTDIDMKNISYDELFQEIKKTSELMQGTINKTSWCFRPSYDAFIPDTKIKIGQLGRTVIMWDVDPQDWMEPGVDVIADHVINYTQNGEVIILHDGGGDRSQTVMALEKILKEMTKDGWEFHALNCVG